MPLRLRTGVAFALLFAVAMGMHFVLTDRGLEERHRRRFDRRGRWVLAAGLLAGWVASVVAAPTRVVVSALTALLAGSVLLNVFDQELPADRETSFAWFTAGLASYAALLALTTYLAHQRLRSISLRTDDHHGTAGPLPRGRNHPRSSCWLEVSRAAGGPLGRRRSAAWWRRQAPRP